MLTTKNDINYGINFNKQDKSFLIKLYAPDVSEIKLNINDKEFFPLTKIEDEFFLSTNKLRFNDRYSFIVDASFEIPDPFSNFQDKKNNIKSVVIKHDNANWTDKDFLPDFFDEAIIYQLHIGCFTKGGTFQEATQKLDYLKELGINFIQLMPIAKFFGKFNWGYDSALHYALDEKYGTPNEFKNFVNEAHKRGIGVFLDVVYSHFAIEGNYLHLLASSKIYNPKIKTPWGDSINYQNKFIKEYIIKNLEFWIENYHIDGFRFDASQVIDKDLLYEIKSHIQPKYPNVYLILENENNEAHYLKNGFDAQWNDDFHHVLKAGGFKDNYKYLADYTKPFSKMMIKTIAQGYYYQGEYSNYKKENKGDTSYNIPFDKFINFIQNHDQIGNRLDAKRLNSTISKDTFKACALLYLLLPQIPMMFMGEEINSQSPFYYFCDFSNSINESINKARKEEFQEYGSLKNYIPSYKEETFLKSKIDWQKKDDEAFEFYKNALKIRKSLVKEFYSENIELSSEILSDESFKVKFGSILILLVNFSCKDISFNFDNVIATSNPLSKKNIIPAMTTLWYKNE